MEYTRLTAEQQAQIINGRIAQFEGEHFNHELNKQGLLAMPDSAEKAQALANTEEAQATIETAIAAAEAALVDLAP